MIRAAIPVVPARADVVRCPLVDVVHLPVRFRGPDQDGHRLRHLTQPPLALAKLVLQTFPRGDVQVDAGPRDYLAVRIFVCTLPRESTVCQDPAADWKRNSFSQVFAGLDARIQRRGADRAAQFADRRNHDTLTGSDVNPRSALFRADAAAARRVHPLDPARHRGQDDSASRRASIAPTQK